MSEKTRRETDTSPRGNDKASDGIAPLAAFSAVIDDARTDDAEAVHLAYCLQCRANVGENMSALDEACADCIVSS